MKQFGGFPARMRFTPIPNVIFSSVLPEIADIRELKVLLHIFELIYPKKGSLKYVSLGELLRHAGTVGSLQLSPECLPEELKRILQALVEKQVLLELPVMIQDGEEKLYFLNSEANRTAIAKIRSGEIALTGLQIISSPPLSQSAQDDIFTLYEQNIGIITPLIAEELKEARQHYPEDWIRDAIKEAVSLNRRSWRYIARILETWSSEGKGNGTYRGNLKKDTDPDKYIRGKYGHMVQR